MKIKMENPKWEKASPVHCYYTIFWDEERGISDDRSFRTRKEAEAFYESLDVPYKRMTITVNDWEDHDIKSEKSDGFPQYFGIAY